MNATYANRLVNEEGRWWWYVGKCGSDCSGPYLTRDTRHLATCCVHNDAPPCTPSYESPAIDATFTTWPQNPLVWGQDETHLGLTIHGVTAHGGRDTVCNSGQQDITSITVQLRLREASKQWIETYLFSRYYGAALKGTYPADPLPNPDYPNGYSGLGSPNATRSYIFFQPLDPGQYDILVRACQRDGQCTNRSLGPVKVWLLDTTLWWPYE